MTNDDLSRLIALCRIRAADHRMMLEMAEANTDLASDAFTRADAEMYEAFYARCEAFWEARANEYEQALT